MKQNLLRLIIQKSPIKILSIYVFDKKSENIYKKLKDWKIER
jgi:hypothetical protein